MWQAAEPELVLASASAARAALLSNAGVAARVAPTSVDEAAIREAMTAEGAPPEELATALAELKATRAGTADPGALIVAADQILATDDTVLAKPATLKEAREQLGLLAGREHRLISAVCVAEGGAVVWRHRDVARLRMRVLSDAFLDAYLDRMGEAALTTVGAYQLEGLGAQLFERVDGDFSTVLGLPLLPLLGFLRQRRVLLS